MDVPTRPVASADIETQWGQAIHDATFAPGGCLAKSGSPRTMGAGNPSSFLKLNLDDALDDPGGYLAAASDQIEVPTNGGGLYLWLVAWNTDNGEDGGETNVQLRINGDAVAAGQIGQEGAVAVKQATFWAGVLSDADVLSVYARQIGTGDRADVHVIHSLLTRLGAELGGP